MGRRALDPDILDKLEQKTGKTKQYLREIISRRASKLGVTSIAAQLLMAQEARIGITRALNKLPPEIRAEVRSTNTTTSIQVESPSQSPSVQQVAKPEPITSATIDALLQDDELRGRCKDLLRARKHFDRVVREATTVLDDRLKKKTGIKRMNPGNLVGKVLNPDPGQAVIEVSKDPAEQAGVHSICRGIMLAFRDEAHHSLSDKFTREDALKFCAFIDSILDIIEKGTVHLDRV